MSFDPANFITILKECSAITTLIGTTPRIYPLTLPLSPTLPAITYQQIGKTRNRVGNLDTDRWQMDCWALTFGSSLSLVNAVWACLESYTGKISNVRIEDICPFNQVSTFEPDSGYYRHMIEFRTVTL